MSVIGARSCADAKEVGRRSSLPLNGRAPADITMAYTTLATMRRLLPKTATIGDRTFADKETQQLQQKADTIPTATANLYIDLATQYIDARLRPIYLCPLKRIVILETDLTVNGAQASDIVQVGDASRFTVGSPVRVRDDDGYADHVVKALFEEDPAKLGSLQLDRELARPYPITKNAMVQSLDFPDPIPMMCARFAVSMVLDKVFTSDQNPDVSEYGKRQRTLAANDLDAILAGAIRLDGQEHTGRRFARISLRDTWASTAQLQAGQGKEN
jgi:hypothetical protein